jgi:putative flippase GtrA/ubiquinone/menaquinone biosynthesis C-methylase UbiE
MVLRMFEIIKRLIYEFRGFIKFGVVGGIGSLVHIGLLYLLTDVGGVIYLISAVISAIVTATFNYTINHFWTFEKTEIRGNWFLGWLKYESIDGIWTIIYVGELALFVEVFGIWYIFGAILAHVINYPFRYLIFKRFVWHYKKLNPSDNNYEWEAFYNGGIIQKWWKQSIANTVWKWIPNNSKLLDIGCGSSPIITHYANAVGIDTNNQKLEFMRSKYRGATFANFQLSDFPDNSFDYVLCIEVIEHVSNPASFVREISRVMKEGGKAIIATPDYSKPLWRIAEMFTPYKEEHCNNFTMDKLDRLCEKNNLMPTIYKYVAGCDLVEMFVKCSNK